MRVTTISRTMSFTGDPLKVFEQLAGSTKETVLFESPIGAGRRAERSFLFVKSALRVKAGNKVRDGVNSGEIAPDQAADRLKAVIDNAETAIPDLQFEAAQFGREMTFQEPPGKWGEAVTAAVVLKENEAATEDEIISFCKQHQASFKAPKSILFIDEIPKTGSGKIYKKALRDPYWEKDKG